VVGEAETISLLNNISCSKKLDSVHLAFTYQPFGWAGYSTHYALRSYEMFRGGFLHLSTD
jgi:hypothetical protein